MELPDIQDQRDERGIDIDEVGIAGVRYPVRFNDGTLEQTAIATFDVTVALPADRRGTHMSRMVEIIDEHLQDVDPRELPSVLKVAADRLDVDDIRVVVSLPLAFKVSAPESGRSAWQACDVTLVGQLASSSVTVATVVTSEVTSLCPCSKAISDYGAHNQRSQVTLKLIGCGADVYPIDVTRAFSEIREVGSSPVFPLLKRVDERLVTMAAHDTPAFVEDIARDLSRRCRAHGVAHEVAVRNLESIHSHDAVAQVRWFGATDEFTSYESSEADATSRIRLPSSVVRALRTPR